MAERQTAPVVPLRTIRLLTGVHMRKFTNKPLSSEDCAFAETVHEALIDDPDGAARLLVYMRELLAVNGVEIPMFEKEAK